LFRNKKLIHVESKLFLFNEIWVFYANNFKLLRDTWVAEALYVKHDNSKITTYGGNLAIERRGKVISGYISANENSVLFTAGPEAITLERLKNIIQDEEEKFSTYAADPGSGSISDPNLRAVIYQNGVYAHLVGSPQLSAQENDSAYASRVWLDKELPSTQVLTKVEHFIDPTDYSSGGLSARNVYPNGKSGSIQISIQYAYFGVTLNFPVSSSSGEANGRSRSFITLVNNSIWGWNKSNYLYDNYKNKTGIAGDFYIYMMGGSKSGNLYSGSWSVKVTIYDSLNRFYFTRGGSSTFRNHSAKI